MNQSSALKKALRPLTLTLNVVESRDSSFGTTSSLALSGTITGSSCCTCAIVIGGVGIEMPDAN